jgi:hypothetical protein
LKREKFLWPLTHGHQHALSAIKITRERLIANPTDGALAGEVRAFFENDLVPHFAAEEEMLASARKTWGLDDPDLKRTLADHAELRRLMNLNDVKSLPIFTGLLEKHIRFEEEPLFGRFQKLFTPEEAVHWGKRLKSSVSACPILPARPKP